MKKLIVLMMGMLISFSLFSQEDLSNVKTSKQEFKANTLFSKETHKPDIQLGYFFEMNAGYTKFGSENAFLPGIDFGMILNHNWSVGLSGSFIGNPKNLYYDNIYHTETGSAMLGANLMGGYGGFLFEYTAFPRSVVHFSIPVMIGGGYFAYIDDFYFSNNDYHNGNMWNYNTIDDNYCFVIEPGIKAEFNIIKMLKLGLGVSYRYSPNFNLVNTADDLLNQFTGRVSLRFGKF
jgi:hypothetical protein